MSQPVLEIAAIAVLPGHEESFVAAVRQALPLFKNAAGCRSVALRRSIETPNLFRLMIEWESIEDHTVGFRGSPAFARWRELAGPHFARPPEVDHSTTAMDG